MLYADIIVHCSENHIKYINTICGQYFEFLNVKRGGTVHMELLDHSVLATKVTCMITTIRKECLRSIKYRYN
jgi:hypothetical protein